MISESCLPWLQMTGKSVLWCSAEPDSAVEDLLKVLTERGRTRLASYFLEFKELEARDSGQVALQSICYRTSLGCVQAIGYK